MSALKINIKLLFLFVLMAIFASNAQKDSTNRIVDSLRNNFLMTQSKQLKALENTRIKDSIRKVALQKAIGELSTVDNVKKQELLDELGNLKNKETERIKVKQHKIDSLRNFVRGFEVIPFFHDTLFSIYTKIGSSTAKDRAQTITKRIKALADDYFFKADSLKAEPNETTIDIFSGDIIIMSISENDALWNNTSKENLAAHYKKIIGNAVMNYKKATNFTTIIKQVGLAILVLLVLGFIIYLIVKLFRFTKTKIEAQKNKRIKGIKIRKYKLFTATNQLKLILKLNTILKWIVIITVVYIALTILFSIFPWTKGFASVLISYFINPIHKITFAIWKYLPNLFTIIVIYIVFRYIIKGVHYLKTEIERGALKLPGFFPDWANPTYQIVRILIYAFMFVVIFPYLPGSDSPVFQGVSVFLGLLFTFGSSGSLSNIIAGLVLTYMRAFKIGDRVKIGEITGDIIEKSLLVTRIRTIKNEIISIPNSAVMNIHTINYSSDAPENGLIINTTVTIGYDTPWKDIHQALIEAATRTEFLLKEPKPFVLQTSLGDFYVSYQINAHTKEPNKQAEIYSYLHQNIQDCCNEAGIEILSPHYRSARDGNMTTIPADYLDKKYKAPPFNVNITKDEK